MGDKYFVIKFKSDGLDINKLIDKCKLLDEDNEYRSQIRDLQSYYKYKEVLARVSNYTVIEYQGIPLTRSDELIQLY